MISNTKRLVVVMMLCGSGSGALMMGLTDGFSNCFSNKAMAAEAKLVSRPQLASRSEAAALAGIDRPSAIDLFQAMEDGLVEAKFIARSSSKGRLVLANKTKKPINVQLPDAFIGVPVLAQGGFGGGGGGGGLGGGGGGGGGGQQSVGGGGGMGGGGMGGGGMGGGGGQFNIAPEKVGRIDLPLLCLNHGLRDPSSIKPYAIRPIEQHIDRPAVIEVVKAFARGELPRSAAQAAVWHLNSDVSWQELAAKLTGTARNFVRNPYFSSQEIRAAMNIANRARHLTAGQTIERSELTPSLAEEPAEEEVDEYGGNDPTRDE
ncbi:MAG: hypothetical protein ABGX16_03095 [Pirellulales bacterium]